jgi:hypothetical protein
MHVKMLDMHNSRRQGKSSTNSAFYRLSVPPATVVVTLQVLLFETWLPSLRPGHWHSIKQ